MAKGQSDKQVMSGRLKMELARELGVADIVEREGWGSVPAKDCGRLVKLAVERAERMLQESRR